MFDEVLKDLCAAWATMEDVQENELLTTAWRKRVVTIQRKINDLHQDIAAD